MLGDKWKVGNFGVSGRTLLKKGDHPYWTEKAYQNALAFKPDVVIIMLGTNDTKPQNWKHKDEFVADYTELVKSFLTLESKPRVYVCRPCPVPGTGNYGINEAGVKEQIPLIDALAAKLNLGVIDMHAALEGKPETASRPRPSERRRSRGNGRGRRRRPDRQTRRRPGRRSEPARRRARTCIKSAIDSVP